MVNHQVPEPPSYQPMATLPAVMVNALPILPGPLPVVTVLHVPVARSTTMPLKPCGG